MSYVSRVTAIGSTAIFGATLGWQSLGRTAKSATYNAAFAVRTQLAVGTASYLAASAYPAWSCKLGYLNRLVAWPVLGYSLWELAKSEGFTGEVYDYIVPILAAIIFLYLFEMDSLQGTVSEASYPTVKWALFGLALAAISYASFKLVQLERFMLDKVNVGSVFLIPIFGFFAGALATLIGDETARCNSATLINLATQTGYAIAVADLVYQ